MSRINSNIKIFLFGFIYLNISFLYLYILIYRYHSLFVIILYIILINGFWYLSVKLNYNFNLKEGIGYWKYTWLQFKSLLVFSVPVLLLSIVIKPENDFRYSAVSFAIYAILSTSTFIYFHISNSKTGTDEVIPKIFDAPLQNVTDLEGKLNIDGKYSVSCRTYSSAIISDKLKNVYFKSDIDIYKRIEHKLDINSIDLARLSVIRSPDEYNVEILPDNNLHLFINLHEFNDIRRLNSYIINVNKKLINGGVFIGKFEPIEKRFTRYINRYSVVIGRVAYIYDFIWRRVIPKIPILQKIYFGVSKGKNRAISLAESLGRLYYCGFKIYDIFEIQNFVYFIAIKAKEPLTDENPSYGPLFKMKRIGKDGKEIYVYKLRTMHPYSEYLQKFMFDYFGSENGDKIDKDFRVTSWGLLFRKLWIDELPMLFNYLKGELKIVGVRPLSLHKFSIYPKELQELRIMYKPGLLPPFYADLPKNLNQLFDSEKKYLMKCKRSPFLTDFRYFFKASYNIFIRRARSS